MSSKNDQQFTDEAVTYGHTTKGNDQIPVVDDSKYQGEGMDSLSADQADSDQQLAKDEKEAIDESNIIKGDRTRHAKATAGGYKEKEEEDLPAEVEQSGRSSM